MPFGIGEKAMLFGIRKKEPESTRETEIQKNPHVKEIGDCLTTMDMLLERYAKEKSERNMALLEETMGMFWLELGQKINALGTSE